MAITVENQQKKINLNPQAITKIVQKILIHQKVKDYNLSFAFVSAQKIIALNRKFLGRAYATDVLSFDLSDELSKKSSLEGEVIISTDATIKNARLFKTPVAQELTLYIIHGILHLLGFDDHSEKDIKKMREQEQKILEYLGKSINGVTR